MIGLFTLAMIASGFGFVYWFSRAGDGGERAVYRVVFDGAVSGLRQGGWVLFNGIKVGEVSDLKLNPDNPRQVVATIAVDKGVPMRADTRVGLDFQGLTGIASISVKGGSPDAPPLVSEKGQPATLIADASATQDVTTTIRDVAASTGALVRRLDEVLADNRDTLKSTLSNLEVFSSTLARNSERLDRIMAGLDNFTSGDIKTELVDTARSMRTLTDNLDKRTAEISVGLTRFSNNGLREYEALAVDARRTLADLGRAIRNFDRNPQRVLFGPSSTDATPAAEGTPAPAAAASAARPAAPARAAAPRRAPRPAASARAGSQAAAGR